MFRKPLKFPNFFRLAVFCLLAMVILAACGRTRQTQTPRVPKDFPPAVEMRSGQGEPFSQSVQPQSIRRIHDRLLSEAQQSFQKSDYPQAIRGLTRLLGLNPEASLKREGHWLLGQSYDQVKDWDAAIKEYGILASAPSGESYQSDSTRRLKEIQELLEKKKSPPLATQAIRFALHQLPAADGFDQGIKKMRQDGATTLLIDLGCERIDLNQTAVPNIQSPSAIRQLQVLLRDYAMRSHRAGLLLYIGVNLRCLGNWAPSKHEAWRDRTYQVNSGLLKFGKQFDLFHPAYQEFLARILSRLCKEEIDGVVLLNDHPLGLFDGVTRVGIKRFEKQFSQDFSPSRVFYEGFDPLGDSNRTQNFSSATKSKDSLFWRWAGWKARERLTVLEALVNRLRSKFSSVQFGLELHPHGLTDPVGALVTYAEDAMDAAGRSFSFFFIRPEIDRRSTFTEQAVVAKLRRISTKAVLDRLLPVVDDPRRVWVSMPAKSGQRLRPKKASVEASPLHDFPSGIGVVHDLRAFS